MLDAVASAGAPISQIWVVLLEDTTKCVPLGDQAADLTSLGWVKLASRSPATDQIPTSFSRSSAMAKYSPLGDHLTT
jgi:hypothetical protein